MLVVRSQRWYFSGKASRGSCIEESVLKRLYCIGRFLSQLGTFLFEAPDGLLLRLGFENPVEQVFHLVVAIGGRSRPSTFRWKWA